MDVFESKASAQTQESTGTNLTPAAGTRHHTLMNSNETPLDSDIPLIKAMGSYLDVRMLALDEEIAPLRRRLEQLVDERQALVHLRSQNSAIISPLRRIPPEILAEIFTWTLPAVWTERHRFKSDDSPWLLTHVSRGWRTTAISTSSLWSLVVIDYPPKLNLAGLYPLPMLEAHIGRAQKLNIHFYGQEARDLVPQIDVFMYLASHSSRWEELSLGVTSALVPLLDSLQDRLPSLRRLNIQWSEAASQANVDSIDCFHRAPCLVDFTVLNEFRSVPVRLPIEQLTCFRADNSWEFHQGALGLGLNLVEVRISIAFDDEPWPAVTQVIHLPSLRRLYVSHPEMLAFLIAPALDEIALESWLGDGEEIQSNFRPFVERSRCTLRRLCLHGGVEAATLSHLLKGTTTITELAILRSIAPGAEHDDVALFDMLTIAPETPHIAPQLQSISLGCEPGNSLDRSRCLAMIHSRWKQPHRALRAADLLSAAAEDPVDDLNMREEGLDLMIQSGQLAQEVMKDWTYNPTWI
ncbi:hypothetical protein C8R46DRAFT_434030 [Mycena filopes]|nr:hypothetical protein C8R46DRAFT_434030 [Mycena filopes]